MKRKKIDKWLLLTPLRFFIIIGAWILAMVLHNLIYALFYNYFLSTGGDEPFFFIFAAIIIPLYFIICFVYTLIKKIRDKSLFETRFVINLLIAVIFGAGIIWFIIDFGFLNSEMGFMLTGIFIIFSFIFYSLIKLINKSSK